MKAENRSELDAIFEGFSTWAKGPDGNLKSSKPAARALSPIKKQK